RVADDVEEENVRDLKLDLLFNLGRHPGSYLKTKQFIIPLSGPTVESKAGPLATAADRAEQVAQIHSIRVLFRDLSVPVVQRKEQGFPNEKRALLHQSA